MKWTVSVLAAASALACSAPAAAEVRNAAAVNAPIKIVYETPADAKLRPVYDRLRQRHVLEEMQEFLNVLHLPRELTLRTAQCGATTAPRQANGPATICYEQILENENLATSHSKDPAVQQMVIVGSFVMTALHETAVAIFDALDVPVWGREEDAADRLAALIMMQFGDDIANMTIVGTAQRLIWAEPNWTGAKYASTASPEYQRLYNFACIAVGANWWEFNGWLNNGLIPARRAGPNGAYCDSEYAQIKKAFNLRIMPYVDADKFVAMRSKAWLSWAPSK